MARTTRAMSAPDPSTSLVRTFAADLNIDPAQLISTLKSTCFRQRSGDPEVSNDQMAMLLVVAKKHGLNPLTKEIYAYPDKQKGIVAVVGVDGWIRIVNEHPKFSGMRFDQPDRPEWIYADDDAKICPEWIECTIYRSDREKPTVIREYLDECYRPAFVGKPGTAQAWQKTGAWQSHTKRMLRTKTLVQAARVAFGFAGLSDDDEALRILESEPEPYTHHVLTDQTESTDELNARIDAAREANAETLPAFDNFAPPAEPEPEPEPEADPPAEPEPEPKPVTTEEA